QLLNNRLIFWNFAVQHAQRIRLRAALAINAHASNSIFQRIAQCLQVNWTVIGTTDRVQLESPALNAESVKQRRQHLQHFSINGRRLTASSARPNDFRTDLVELAIAPFLRALTAKLRANVIEALQSWPFPQFVFDISADNAGRVLRPKSQPLAFFALSTGAVFPGKR